MLRSVKLPDNVRRRRGVLSRVRAAAAVAPVSCSLVLLAAIAGRADDENAPAAVPNDNIADHADLGRSDSPRSAADRARDGAEKPAVIAAFANVGPRDKVADLRARDGYLAEVLALAAYPYGKVFANNDPDTLSDADAEAWSARLERPELSDVARYDLPLAAPLPTYASGLDVVVCSGAYADAIRRNIDRQAMNAAVLKALHPGGLYVIADARAAATADLTDSATLCRTSEARVREEVERAGFRFVEASEALTQAGDAHTGSACQPAKGQASDRFLLEFQKPAEAPAPPPPSK